MNNPTLIASPEALAPLESAAEPFDPPSSLLHDTTEKTHAAATATAANRPALREFDKRMFRLPFPMISGHDEAARERGHDDIAPAGLEGD
ncbi:hypothetical protein [Gordonia amicalis]|uniref:Uncharacterized protein n=1 Tax=Gordonia amicalis TaxID=89053 RepID=A0AAE4UBP7_9ACTN|nr:hypothetical protein [Gordonia amicalis]MDV6313682.1 hypothetical protein [Gordonia amicalis]